MQLHVNLGAMLNNKKILWTSNIVMKMLALPAISKSVDVGNF